GRLLSLVVAGRSVSAGTAMRSPGKRPISTAQFGSVGHHGREVLNEPGNSLKNSGARCPQRAARAPEVNLSPETLGVAGQACCPAGSETRESGEPDRQSRTRRLLP